jgi:hypothetical protein
MPWAILSGEVVPVLPKKPSGIKFLMASIGCPRRPLPKTSKVALNLEELGFSGRVAPVFGAASDSLGLGPEVLAPNLSGTLRC